MHRLVLLALAAVFVAPLHAQIEVGAPVPLTDTADGLAHPRFSPDGRLVALTSPGYDGLWVRDLRTGTTTRLSDESAAGFGAAWSPDGAALVARVARYVDGNRENAVAVFDVAARSRAQLSDYQTRMPALPAWQEGGATVGLATARGVESYQTGRAPVLGKNTAPVLVASGDALVSLETGAVVRQPVEGAAILNVAASPDGRFYAFEVMGSGIFVAAADGSALRALGPGEHPTWSPDGQWVAFMRTRDDGHQLLEADLFAVPASGGTEVRLTTTPDRLELFPQWTPDGTAIAYDDLGEGRVYLLPVQY